MKKLFVLIAAAAFIAPASLFAQDVKVTRSEDENTITVVEDKWNWAYKLTSIQDSEGHEIGDKQTRSATSDDLEVNPFIFVNTKKTNIDSKVKNAESKAMNIFLPGETVGHYSHSKE